LADHPAKEFHRLMKLLLSRLDEDHRRWYVALESLKVGHGGDRQLARITGLNVEAIRRGRRELANSLGGFPAERIRRPGGGRPPLKKNPLLVTDLKRLADDHIGGHPTTVRKFVRRSLRNLSKDLKRCGHRASHTTVGKLLHEADYAPKANQKRYASSRHPDRDRQFRYIAKLKRVWLAAGWPVISIDAKKKELIGNCQSRGRTWSREAEAVNTRDFPQDALARAVPYGLYILNQNRGYVRLGLSANTAEFAVDTIASWGETDGQPAFPHVRQLLIFADGGGSNGCRPRLWKLRLQTHVADRFGLEVMVCHYPTGASHYNPVEHRLFGPISNNWAGTPLRSLPLMLACIRGTRTETGLQVKASLNRKQYRTKIKVSDQEMKGLIWKRHKVCPTWNYTIKPRKPPQK
jgi:hypothetical protein